MSTIRDMGRINSYNELYGNSDTGSAVNKNNSSFLSGLSISSDNSAFNLNDYSMIKNGSYRKLMKAYYANEKAQNTSSGKDSVTKLTTMSERADSMGRAVRELMDKSLWEKKTFTRINETTGEEETYEDYDRDSIAGAVKNFVESYNKAIDAAGESNVKGVLRNAAWMTKTTAVNEKLLSKVGITIGADNKLSVDEKKLGEADISTLKTLFTGYGSYADKISDKADAMINAAKRAGGTYNSKGEYNNVLSELVSSKIDTKE